MSAGPRRLGHRIVSGLSDCQHRAELCDGDRHIQGRVITAATSALREFCQSELRSSRAELPERSDHRRQLPERGDLQLWYRYNGELVRVQLRHTTHRQHYHQFHSYGGHTQRHRHQSRQTNRRIDERVHGNHGWSVSPAHSELCQSQFQRSAAEFAQRHHHRQQLPERGHLQLWCRYNGELLHVQLRHTTHRQHHHQFHSYGGHTQRYRHQSRQPNQHSAQWFLRDRSTRHFSDPESHLQP